MYKETIISDLFNALIEKHGKDRYPTPELAFIKLAEEFGEVADAFLRGDEEATKMEMADVLFALQGLARHYNEGRFNLLHQAEVVVAKAGLK